MYFAGTSDHERGGQHRMCDLEKKGGVWKGLYLCEMTVAFEVNFQVSEIP